MIRGIELRDQGNADLAQRPVHDVRLRSACISIARIDEGQRDILLTEIAFESGNGVPVSLAAVGPDGDFHEPADDPSLALIELADVEIPQ